MRREAFTINRQLEFFTESELSKQLGHSRTWWPAVLVAELVDNALDHCEEAGILPDISVRVTESAITVTDNGRGIPPAVVASMVDFETRTSSRLGYACPTRGAQGNAALCIIALPYVVDGAQGKVEIDAAGVCHSITTTMDSIARMPIVDHVTAPGKVQIGTSVNIQLPCSIDDSTVRRIVHLLGEYAAFNSHAQIELDFFGDSYRWRRTTTMINKWTAKNPDPAQWYDQRSFENLVAACIQLDRAHGKSRTVREFIRQFAGLKRSDTVKSVLEATGTARCDLLGLTGPSGVDHQKAACLLDAMQSATDSPKPIKLGVIGRRHIEAALGGEATYKRVVGSTAAGLPFIVEAAFRERDEDDQGRRLFTGVNFSVDVREPSHNSVSDLLSAFMAYRLSPVDVLLHITTPRVEYTNRGKTEIDVCALVEQAIEDSLKSVTRKYTAKMKAQERDASRVEQYAPRKPKAINLKEAVFAVMEESIDSVSQGNTCDFAARNHYYAVRPLVQRYTDKPLTQKYLDKVIDEWEAVYGIIERRTRDPRGFLLEPHTGRQIPLGTRQVDSYCIPLHLYHTIIYVEKKGLLSNFQFGKIAEKYDAAIICAEGYAVRAAQSLMQAAAIGRSMKVFVFHDADPAGYGIANAIGQNSGAHKFDFEIIDAGLRLDEALEMGLPTETFTRLKSLPREVYLTPTERSMFQGTKRQVRGKNGKLRDQWTGCQRVELNALAAHPQRFVDWAESKIQEHGAAKKLVPVAEIVADTTARKYRTKRMQRIQDAVKDALDIPSIVAGIDAKLPQPDFHDIHSKLVRWANKLEPVPWEAVCDSIASAALDPLLERIERAAMEACE